MSHAVAHPTRAEVFSEGNTTIRAGSAGTALIGVGLACLAVVAGVGVLTEHTRHAIAAYHMGVMTVLALCLGCLFFVMVFHLTQAGWSASIRRQFENVMSLVWLPALLVLSVIVIEVLTSGRLFGWLGVNPGEDVLLDKKRVFLNPFFFTVRALFYTGIWCLLALKLWGFSRDQDRTGNKWLTNRARFTSSWGMLIFALTTAFAAFDWLMSIDWRFYSTMWGVYYFAGAAYSSVPLVILILVFLRRAGKLRGAVTDEHLHDLSKLSFGFMVFWAYIAFSQYFLIWYANIPEETSFILARKEHGWHGLFVFLCLGHFLIPWYFMLWRFVRRSFALMALFSAWAVLMEAMDVYWIVRPLLYAGPGNADKLRLDMVWLDALGIGGVLVLFVGVLIVRISSGPLLPLRDPRIHEALTHKNFV